VLTNEQKIDRFAGDLCSALVSANYLRKLAVIFLALTATAIAGDRDPAKITIHVRVVPVVRVTRADCTSRVQTTHTGTLATFTLPVEPGYECIEDIRVDLDIKAVTSTDLASQAGPRAVVIRHTYILR
jgi:hypothetical protein